MGTLSFDLDDVVTKTTGGLIVLPREHYLVTRKDRPRPAMHRIGKSACDQCSYCTEFCPRYLLGYEVQPHKVMRSLGFTLTGGEHLEPVGGAVLRLRPVHAVRLPRGPVSQGSLRPGQGATCARPASSSCSSKPVRVHPMKESRRVPLAQLRRRLQGGGIRDGDAVRSRSTFARRRCGSSCRSTWASRRRRWCAPGEKVTEGQLVARVDGTRTWARTSTPASAAR